MGLKLQLALDDITLEKALELLEKVQGDVDIAEVGTPFMMEYGMEAVRKIKMAFPELEVLCDAKIMDAGRYEAMLALEAGADYVTVLGVTEDRTIAECVLAARSMKAKVAADMICVKDFSERIPKLEDLGVDVIAVHTGIDQQAAGRMPLDDLREMRKYVKRARVAVAGGINIQSIGGFLRYSPEIVIVGGGITRAEDPVKAARELAARIHA